MDRYTVMSPGLLTLLGEHSMVRLHPDRPVLPLQRRANHYNICDYDLITI